MCEETERHRAGKGLRRSHTHDDVVREYKLHSFLKKQIYILRGAKCCRTISAYGSSYTHRMHRHTIGWHRHAQKCRITSERKRQKMVTKCVQIDYEIHRFTFNCNRRISQSYRQLGPFRARSLYARSLR